MDFKNINDTINNEPEIFRTIFSFNFKALEKCLSAENVNILASDGYTTPIMFVYQQFVYITQCRHYKFTCDALELLKDKGANLEARGEDGLTILQHSLIHLCLDSELLYIKNILFHYSHDLNAKVIPRDLEKYPNLQQHIGKTTLQLYMQALNDGMIIARDNLTALFKKTSLADLKSKEKDSSHRSSLDLLIKYCTDLDTRRKENRNKLQDVGMALMQSGLPLTVEKEGTSYLFFGARFPQLTAKCMGLADYYNLFNLVINGGKKLDTVKEIVSRIGFNVRNHEGFTPLYLACYHLQVDVVQALIDCVERSKDRNESSDTTKESIVSLICEPISLAKTEDDVEMGNVKESKTEEKTNKENTQNTNSIQNSQDSQKPQNTHSSSSTQSSPITQINLKKPNKPTITVIDLIAIMYKNVEAKLSEKEKTAKDILSNSSNSDSKNEKEKTALVGNKHKKSKTSIDPDLAKKKAIHKIRAILMNTCQYVIDFHMFKAYQNWIYDMKLPPRHLIDNIVEYEIPLANTGAGKALLQQAITKALYSPEIISAAVRFLQEIHFAAVNHRIMLRDLNKLSVPISPISFYDNLSNPHYPVLDQFANLRQQIKNEMDNMTTVIDWASQQPLGALNLAMWAFNRQVAVTSKDRGKVEIVPSPIKLKWPRKFIVSRNRNNAAALQMVSINASQQNNIEMPSFLTEDNGKNFPWIGDTSALSVTPDFNNASNNHTYTYSNKYSYTYPYTTSYGNNNNLANNDYDNSQFRTSYSQSPASYSTSYSYSSMLQDNMLSSKSSSSPNSSTLSSSTSSMSTGSYAIQTSQQYSPSPQHQQYPIALQQTSNQSESPALMTTQYNMLTSNSNSSSSSISQSHAMNVDSHANNTNVQNSNGTDNMHSQNSNIANTRSLSMDNS